MTAIGSDSSPERPSKEDTDAASRSLYAATDRSDDNWENVVTFTAPPAIVAFFAYISRVFLINPPCNDIVDAHRGDARWVFYLWVSAISIVSITMR
jgi:hypothetical protein